MTAPPHLWGGGAERRRGSPDLFLWLGVVAAAWIAAYWLELSGGAHVLHHHTIYHSGQIVAGGITLLGAWQVMTAAMMLPGTLPVMLHVSRPAAQLAFMATYAAAWTGFAAIAFVGDMGLHALVHGWALAARYEYLIPVAVLGMAAAYELSPWKRAGLAACRQPLNIRASVLEAGIAYSRHCLMSGWALMLIMFSAGVADLAWMAGLALVMLAQKTLSSGDRLRYVVAGALALLALEALLRGGILAARMKPVGTAGFGVRTVAYLVDAFLLGFVGGAFPYLVITTSSSAPASGQQATASGGGSVLVSLIYFVIFWSWIGGGRTIGMRLFKLRVVRERDWAPLSLWNAVVRWLGLWVSFALCFVGVIWVAFDPRHQGWHDKIARTLVVHA